MHDGRLKIAVTAPPVDGEANAAVIELLAKPLGIARGAVEVIAGASSRRKTLRIAGVTAPDRASSRSSHVKPLAALALCGVRRHDRDGLDVALVDRARLARARRRADAAPRR